MDGTRENLRPLTLGGTGWFPAGPLPDTTKGALMARPRCVESERPYLRCLPTSLVISNIETLPLPPNTALRLASALIMRRSLASWSPFFLIYTQSFLVTSVRGIGVEPTTVASKASGCTGLMNAAFGLRFAFFFGAAFFAGFFAFFTVFLAAFFAPFFALFFAFFAAMWSLL